MSNPEPLTALDELLAGNRRFVAGKATHPNQTPEVRSARAAGQRPIAVIAGCSDSRVPPEIIFDRGLGDLFVVRTAGHVLDDAALGSIEYAVGHLGVSLVLVLGHSHCGAVSAALNGERASGHLTALLAAVRYATMEAEGQSGDPLDNAVRANVRRAVRQLRSSTLSLTKAADEASLEIRGAVYDLASGAVELLP